MSIDAPSATNGRSPVATGLLAGLGAFLIWGIINPFYFKAVANVEPIEILAHRIVWTSLMLGIYLAATAGPVGLARAVGSWRRLGILAVSTALITVNWGVFIWAVQQSRLVETSLGYYINPLINVLLGVVALGERLTRRQTVAVALACLGVLTLVAAHGTLPWVSLVLAVSFGLYGLVRKRVSIDPVAGLMVETTLLLPLAGGFLLWLGSSGGFGTIGTATDVLLVLAGPVTAVPLLLFVVAAQRLKLSTVGILQYIGPTGQLVVGVLVYGESFSIAHGAAFALIWAGLGVFSADAWSSHRADIRSRAAAAR